MKKVGIMGGTFNPIHIAHLILAEHAYEQYGLDKIVFLPSKRPAYKELENVIDELYRQKMIELAISNNSHFEINTMEFSREGNTYTADTLIDLKSKNPDTSYYFIVGADSLFQMEQWSRPEVVFEKSIILAAQREDKSNEDVLQQMDVLKRKYQAKIFLVKIPQIDISSSRIREAVANGRSIKYLVLESVENYIRQQQLYKKDFND